MTLELDLNSGSSLVARKDLRSSKAGSFRFAAVFANLLSGRILPTTVPVSGDSSANAMQSSVRLRHMLSAFLRNCRSIALEMPAIDAVLGETSCALALPTMAANVSASVAVASKGL